MREIDLVTCEVVNAGDFCAHRFPVSFLATDTISDGLTEVVASIDVTGQLMIWTVSRLAQSKGIISRRPQRVFRCLPGRYLKCDLSWAMGIVAVCNKDVISVFSIEKNEIIHRWSVVEDNTPASSSSSSSSPSVCPKRLLYPQADSPHLQREEGVTAATDNDWHVIIRKIVLSKEGIISVSIEAISTDMKQSTYYLASFTLSGIRTGVVKCNSPITFLSCCSPGRNNNVLAVGYHDGSVEFNLVSSVEQLFSFTPHMSCAHYENEPAFVYRAFVGSSSGNSSVEGFSNAILHIAVNLSVISVTSMSGNMFLKALPDFVRFERERTSTSFQKLVSHPMQTVQQHAQNISDAAGSLKITIDEAIGELKKVLFFSIIKSLRIAVNGCV